MEESDLLKERLQAITDKHRIQEDIRKKKVELDYEKSKLQHLKKKSLREQWLLHDAASHNATDSSQSRVLQLNIHRMERELQYLEREESMISSNESFIINRLKAVERSSEDIIKEAQENFVPEPLQVAMVIPHLPETPHVDNHSEPNAPRKTLFAMEINVSRNLLTGEKTVLSTADVPPEELIQQPGLKVYDDGRKCVYALNSHQGSHDRSCAPELSAGEVEQLLRSVTKHRQANSLNHRHPVSSRRVEHCVYNHRQDERGRVCGLGTHGGHHGNHSNNNAAERGLDCRQRKTPQDEHRYGYQERPYGRQEERLNYSNLRDGHTAGNHKGAVCHYGNQTDHRYSTLQVRKSHSAQDCRPGNHHSSNVTRSNSRVNGLTPSNGCPPPRSHDQEVVSPYQPQLCYTPLNHIPLKDYISVDDEELYCYNPPSYNSALYADPAPSDRVPSPVFGDDAPYTILNAVETTEPITAIFMGFQTAQDDSEQGQGFEGALKAELVIIEDNEENGEAGDGKKSGHAQAGVGSAANGNGGCGEALRDRRTERRGAPGTPDDM